MLPREVEWEGWKGHSGGRGYIYIYIVMTDSSCMAEINTVL